MNGVLHADERVTILDTRAMPWEDHPGVPGGRIKVLSRDAAGDPMVMINWLPPRTGTGLGERHYHRSVVEHGYVLAGELPLREYEDPADEDGVLVTFRSEYFYSRRPGSVHGVDPARRGRAVGFLILEWRSAAGTFLWEPGVERETISMPLPERPAGSEPSAVDAAETASGSTVFEHEHVTIVDTRMAAWDEAGGESKTRVQILEREDGRPSIALVATPSGAAPEPCRFPSLVCNMGYVVLGEALVELSGAPTTGAVRLAQGCFYELRDGAELTAAPGGPAMGIGCVTLQWNGRPGVPFAAAG